MTPFSATELVARARRHGGKLRIRNGQLQVKFVTPAGGRSRNKLTSALTRLLFENAYQVKAVLREEAAARAYQRSGHRPDWWKRYDSGTEIDVLPGHIEHTTMPDEDAIVKVPPEACFAEIKRLVQEHKASDTSGDAARLRELFCRAKRIAQEPQ